VLVLFGDRCPPDPVWAVPGISVELGGAAGAAWLNHRLAAYRISVRLPPKRKRCSADPF
jgi:hypothetical protein